jgi:hypothetical protein
MRPPQRSARRPGRRCGSPVARASPEPADPAGERAGAGLCARPAPTRRPPGATLRPRGALPRRRRVALLYCTVMVFMALRTTSAPVES